MALCNDVKVDLINKHPHFIGDPTEIALVKFAYEKVLTRMQLRRY